MSNREYTGSKQTKICKLSLKTAEKEYIYFIISGSPKDCYRQSKISVVNTYWSVDLVQRQRNGQTR